MSSNVIISYSECIMMSVRCNTHIILDFAEPGHFTCRNDSSIELPLAYLCEGPPHDYGHYHKRSTYDYYDPYYYINCPDGSDESPDTCGKPPHIYSVKKNRAFHFLHVCRKILPNLIVHNNYMYVFQ